MGRRGLRRQVAPILLGRGMQALDAVVALQAGRQAQAWVSSWPRPPLNPSGTMCLYHVTVPPPRQPPGPTCSSASPGGGVFWAASGVLYAAGAAGAR